MLPKVQPLTSFEGSFLFVDHIYCYKEVQWLGMYRPSETRAGKHRRDTHTRNTRLPTQADHSARGAREQPPNQGTIHAAEGSFLFVDLFVLRGGRGGYCHQMTDGLHDEEDWCGRSSMSLYFDTCI